MEGECVSRFLLEAVPLPDPHKRNEENRLLTGELPSPVNPPSGCRFHTRCPYAADGQGAHPGSDSHPCQTWGKSLDLSVPWLPHPRNGYNGNPYLKALLCEII